MFLMYFVLMGAIRSKYTAESVSYRSNLLALLLPVGQFLDPKGGSPNATLVVLLGISSLKIPKTV